MVEIKFDACYLIIRVWDFSLDFTERVTYIYTLPSNILGLVLCSAWSGEKRSAGTHPPFLIIYLFTYLY